jgi:hypothetical protein
LDMIIAGRDAPFMTSSPATITIRRASGSDAVAIERLAYLDSRPVPRAPHLVALVDDRLVAAASLADGALVADPFAPSAHPADLLRERVEALTGLELQPAGGAFSVLSLMRGLFPASPRRA